MRGERPRGRPLLGDIVAAVAALLAERVDRLAGWDRLPPGLGVVSLLGLRHNLRRRNLYDTEPAEARRVPVQPAKGRTIDGSGNDPLRPRMGATDARFGRNAPPVVEDESRRRSPDPRAVSDRLLTRTTFFPAETLNLLAAAWIQFEVHDWFAHRTEPPRDGHVPDDAPAPPRPLAPAPGDGRSFPTFLSAQTHWWDASQLYGADERFAATMLAGDAVRLKKDEPLWKAMSDGLESARADGSPAPVPNLWLGTACFHNLFAKEHNAICDALEAEYGWQGRKLHDTARLINSAVMAKIHTVEWTPAIIAHPTTSRGAAQMWWGMVGRRCGGRWAHRSRDEMLTGIPGSRRNLDGAHYALTEEFVSVYRMHQLIPDRITFRRASNREHLGTKEMEELAAVRGGRDRPFAELERIGDANALYSLAHAHPGQITLQNYPRFLQELKSLNHDGILNMGELDIVRTRETGVPRYNNFRRLFRLAPARDFDEIANGNPIWAGEMRAIYDDVEDVDLLIGLFAERKPRGFAFSDTAFRVFLLMAARRLRSDRFFTTDYTPEAYSPIGLRWIDDATLGRIIVRHHPELEPALAGVDNPFQPWGAGA
jgi:hypothetical protein